MLGLRESEFFDKSVTFFIGFIFLVAIFVIINEEVLRELELLA